MTGHEYARRYGADTKRIYYLPHCIDVDYFKNEHRKSKSNGQSLPIEFSKDTVVYLYVGRLITEKGIGYLLDAFRLLRKKIQLKVSLLLAGDGAEEEKFKIKCKHEGINDVYFVGFYQKTELPSIYSLADIFIFPTLGDPYGLVVDEAMACALPVITTSAAGEIDSRVENGFEWLYCSSRRQPCIDRSHAQVRRE